MARADRTGSWVWSAARLAAVFYRVSRVGGALPGGAVLIVANHPNSLLDAALIQATSDRPIRFLAKSTLFHRHPFAFLIRRSGAIPVYRRMDAGVDTTRNVEMFRAVETALEQGAAVCLFPEGLSHDLGRLEPLKTGAARMALACAARGHPVSIMAVGLNFERVVAFRSLATVVFGRPFRCDDLVATHAVDPRGAVVRLTDRIGEHIAGLLVEADPRRDLPLVTQVDRLYAAARGASRNPAARIARQQRVAAGLRHLRAHDPERLDRLTAEIRGHDAELRRFGLRDRDIGRRISAAAAWRWGVRECLLALLLAPLAAAVVVAFAFPYWLTGQVSRWAPDRQTRATWQVVYGAILYGFWIVLLGGAVGVWSGVGFGIAGAAVLTALAFTGLKAVERVQAVARTVRAFVAMQRTPRAVLARLAQRREALAGMLEQAAEQVPGAATGTDPSLRGDGAAVTRRAGPPGRRNRGRPDRTADRR